MHLLILTFFRFGPQRLRRAKLFRSIQLAGLGFRLGPTFAKANSGDCADAGRRKEGFYKQRTTLVS